VGRAIGYLRKSKVSSDRHVSWDVQEVEIRALAAKHGDGDLELLSDWGRSGRGEKRHLRPEYLRLRDIITSGDASVLYAYSLSRLSRSLRDYADLAELCRDYGVTIRLAKEGEFNYASASGRFQVGMLALFAQMEAELAQERARDTIQARRARGDIVGSVGYGQRMRNGRAEPHPDQDVTAVVDAYRITRSFGGTARELNRAQILSHFGRPWSAKTVRQVLQRIVPDDLAVSVRQTQQGVKGKGYGVLYRLLRCPCGQILTPKMNHQRGITAYICYRARYDASHVRPYQVAERRLLPWVQGEIARIRPPEAVVLEERDAGRRAALEARRRRILDNYEDGLIDRADRDRKLEATAAEVERLDARTRLVNVPEIDWSWPTQALSAVLRTILQSIDLDDQMNPVRATWLVPEWRAGRVPTDGLPRGQDGDLREAIIASSH
jgi:DNA invertase Pin-like site-specific DNA recombinase